MIGLLVIGVISVIGLALVKVFVEAERAKNIWCQHTKRVTSVSVHVPTPKNIIPNSGMILVSEACALVDGLGGPRKTVPLSIVVTGVRRDNINSVQRYDHHVRVNCLTGGEVFVGATMKQNGVLDEVREICRLLPALEANQEPVHVIVCAAPRVALLSWALGQKRSPMEVWFFPVYGLCRSQWIREAVRYLWYIGSPLLSKVKRFSHFSARSTKPI